MTPEAGTEDAAPPSSRRRPVRPRRDPAAKAPRDSVEADSLEGTSVVPELDIPDFWRCEDEEDPPESGPRSAFRPWVEARSAPARRDPAVAAPAPPPRAPRRAPPAPAGFGARVRPYAIASAWAGGAIMLSFLALRPAAFAPGDAPPAHPAAAPASDRGAGVAAPPGEQRLAPGERLDLVLRTEARLTLPIAVRAYLVRGGAVRPWDVEVQLEEGGALRVAGAREQLFAGEPDGELEAVLVVGRADALPATPDALLAALRAGAESPRFRLIRRRLVLAPR
ncbi:MAG: hypothetical protein IT372_11545 [Polyangiaceae bacterium]|nr:hypothetical protein [Polyangiaceae bacterium]